MPSKYSGVPIATVSVKMKKIIMMENRHIVKSGKIPGVVSL